MRPPRPTGRRSCDRSTQRSVPARIRQAAFGTDLRSVWPGVGLPILDRAPGHPSKVVMCRSRARHHPRTPTVSAKCPRCGPPRLADHDRSSPRDVQPRDDTVALGGRDGRGGFCYRLGPPHMRRTCHRRRAAADQTDIGATVLRCHPAWRHPGGPRGSGRRRARTSPCVARPSSVRWTPPRNEPVSRANLTRSRLHNTRPPLAHRTAEAGPNRVHPDSDRRRPARQ